MNREDIEELKKLEDGITRHRIAPGTITDPYAADLKDVVSILRQALGVSQEDALLLAKDAVNRFGLNATIYASELVRRRRTSTWSEAFRVLDYLERKEEKDNVDNVR